MFPGGHVRLRSTACWSSIPSSCHVTAPSPCWPTTPLTFSRTTPFATSPLEPTTPSRWQWVPHTLAPCLHTYPYSNEPVCVCVCLCQACTGGGCTLSPPSQAQTEESTPESVPAPLVNPLSPRALNVSWTPPHTPNGERHEPNAVHTDRYRPVRCIRI